MEAKNYKVRIVLTSTQSYLRRLWALLCFGFFSHMTVIPSPCGVLERLRQSCKWVCGYLGNDRCSCAVSCSLCASLKQGRQDPEQQTQAYRYGEVGAVFPIFVCPSTETTDSQLSADILGDAFHVGVAAPLLTSMTRFLPWVALFLIPGFYPAGAIVCISKTILVSLKTSLSQMNEAVFNLPFVCVREAILI